MRSLLLHDNFTTLASIRFGVLQPHYHDWAWFPPEGKSRWDERSLEFSAILDARQLEKTENHSLEMTRFRQFCMKRHRKESTELETQEPGFYRHTSSRHSHTGLQVTVLRGSRALNRHFPWLLLLLPLPGTQGKGWTAVASCGRCFANSFRLMKNWGQRQNWGTHLIVLHPFHQLTFQLPKKKLERGLRFHILLLEASCVGYCHHFPCQFATYLGIWKRGLRAVLALCRSFIHLFRHLLLSVGRQHCASVSQGNPDESVNFSLQRVYNLVKKLRHVVKTVNNKEHFWML